MDDGESDDGWMHDTTARATQRDVVGRAWDSRYHHTGTTRVRTHHDGVRHDDDGGGRRRCVDDDDDDARVLDITFVISHRSFIPLLTL